MTKPHKDCPVCNAVQKEPVKDSLGRLIGYMVIKK